jgi:3-phenylpropionate/cinnamic acid dioxygenase small subunit
MDVAKKQAIQWACKQMLARYYNHVDQGEFEEAAHIFAPDIEWRWREWAVNGRENMLKDLKSALTAVHIRHLITNTVIKVIDDDHATSLSYVTIYTHRGERADDGSAPHDGPDYINELHDKLVRLDDGWHIAQRHIKTAFERKPM